MLILINHLGGKCRQCHVFFTEMGHFDRQRAVVIEMDEDNDEVQVKQLNNDVDEKDYWNPTEGNARLALLGLLCFAQVRPNGIWEVH